MTTDPNNLVLEHLRHIRGRVDAMAEDMQSLQTRLLSIEHHLAGQHSSEFDQTGEIAQLKVRVELIARRLDLAP